MVKRIVIWAHSECRSNAALFKAVGEKARARGIETRILLWNGMKMPQARCVKIEGAEEIGENLAKGREALQALGGPESVQVFCVYQNSPVFRKLIVEAKRGGARVIVNAEAPCEMCLGLKAMLKRLYYRFILPIKLRSAIKAADGFISASGEFGIERLVHLGWKREQIHAFGYASERLNEPEALTLVGKESYYLYLGSEAEYRGVKIAEKAARKAGVRLVKSGGAMSEKELVGAIRGARAVVACGYCEPWGMRINDALLEGTPVIVSDGMGARMLVRKFGCGVVVGKGDVESLVEAFRRFENAEARAAFRRGTLLAASRWTPERRAERFLALVLDEELTMASFWEEHCTECGEPGCYQSCVHYQAGIGGRCRRLEGGFEERILNEGVDIKFREWGKWEALGHGGAIDETRAREMERMVAKFAWARKLFPKTWRSLRWRAALRGAVEIAPEKWRISGVSERDERLIAQATDDKMVEVMSHALVLKANEPFEFEFEVPPIGEGALYRIYAQDGEATGRIHFDENRLIARRNDTKRVKCVAWDLDGTLWKGTLEDDGVEGLALDAVAMVVVRELDRRGIVNSIASRNDREKAIAALKRLGVEEYFVFPQIGWGPKSEGLKMLAKELNIALETIAFVDDRAEVRGEVELNVEGVKVFDRTEIGTMLARDEFRASENREGAWRRASYRAEMARRAVASECGDYARFLAESALELGYFELGSASAEELARCKELIERSNQLNLTGHHRANLERERGWGITCKDKYGDYGIIGVVIVEAKGEGWRVKEFVMSCRVAKKGLERKAIDWVKNELGARELELELIATGRNGALKEALGL